MYKGKNIFANTYNNVLIKVNEKENKIRGEYTMKICLNDSWKLHKAQLFRGKEEFHRIKMEKEDWYDCSVPCDVRMPLIEYGVIRDPVLADYCHESEWVEKHAWWYFKTFHFDNDPEMYEVTELFIEAIDTQSDIFFNGIWIGSHANVHRPFVKDVKEYLRQGENEIAVRVTTGMENVSDEDLSELNWAICHEKDNGALDRGDYRRAFVRSPQYNVGWDWGPRVVTCGIVGKVELCCFEKIAVREVKVAVKSLGDPAVLDVMANIENFNMFSTRDCDISFQISLDGRICVSRELKRQLITSGYNYINFTVELPDPQLWWPNGYGEQPLYDISFSVVCQGVKEEFPSFKYGVRTVELDVSPLYDEGEERLFTWVVNGQPIFCKGGDWIPSDSIYARISRKKYDVLIKEAIEAHFNVLRIWGGGLFERDYFYELCDKNGLLLWHDFMFACSTYPDHRESFRNEVRLEMDYQTKRLRNHPCMGIWCGNNENHEIYSHATAWGLNYTRERQYGMYTGNVIAKEVIRNNCPEIPYWNSSPYGGTEPGSEAAGDVHHWRNAMMSPEMENRINPFGYDKITAKFVSEYGYIGPCSLDSIKEYFDGNPVERGSKIWNLHNNTYERHTVLAGIEKHYGIKAEDLSMEDYLYYAGAVHGLILGYSLEAIRFKDFCAGAIFWMYNDTWGEVGWTIVDYYLRRKIGYYGVKRAFLPQKVALRVIEGDVVVQLCNDHNEAIDIDARYGYVSFDGSVSELKPLKLTAEPRSRKYILREKLPEYDYRKGTLVVIPEHTIEPASLYTMEFKKLEVPKAEVKITGCVQDGENVRLTVSSDVYAHHVTIWGDYKFSDNYFNMLPGETREIVAYNANVREWKVTSIC